jgi:predicted SnoaL-like aldol condensation-catalyzing enzyme
MGTEENKAVVRRFRHELLAEGNLDVADEVLAPNYVNVAMGGGDAATVKAMVTATNAALQGQRFEDEELVAEGDVVTARIRYILTLPDNTTAEARALAYYRLSDGRIVVNDVMFDPDLMEVLGPLLGPPPD